MTLSLGRESPQHYSCLMEKDMVFVCPPTRKVALESEFVFFSKVFGIEPDGLTTDSFKTAQLANVDWA